MKACLLILSMLLFQVSAHANANELELVKRDAVNDFQIQKNQNLKDARHLKQLKMFSKVFAARPSGQSCEQKCEDLCRGGDGDTGGGSGSCWAQCTKEGYGSSTCASRCGVSTGAGSEACWEKCGSEGYSSSTCSSRCGISTGDGSAACWARCGTEGYGSSTCASRCGTDTSDGAAACWNQCTKEGYGSSTCSSRCGTN